MLKLHDELIAKLTNFLTERNYNPVVVANHRLYARAFLDYLAECDIRVESVTPGQVDQYFHYAIEDFQARYRSEEHTSELQSLMRISYAVFCLNKKNKKQKKKRRK